MLTFDAIFREHQARIWKLANNITRGRGGKPVLEDLVAAGNLALWSVYERYDPLRGTTLWQCAYLRVWGAMLDELRRQDHVSRQDRKALKSSGTSVLDAVPWATLHPVSMEAAEHVPSGKNPEEEAIRAERSKIVFSLLEKLEPQDRWLLQSYAFDGIPMAAIGKKLNLSEARICQLVHRAHDRLGCLMREEGIVDEAFQTRSGSRSEGDESQPFVHKGRGKVQTLTHDGLTLTVREWAIKLGWSPAMIYGRIKQGWLTDQILTLPPGPAKHRRMIRSGFALAENSTSLRPTLPQPAISDQVIEGMILEKRTPEADDPKEVLSIRQRCWRLDQIDSQIASLMAERQGIVASLAREARP